MRRTPRGGSGTGHGHVAERPDVLGISDIKEITWDDYYSQRDTVEFCQREPHLVTIHNENSGKHKIDESIFSSGTHKNCREIQRLWPRKKLLLWHKRLYQKLSV